MLRLSLQPPWGGSNGYGAIVRTVWEQPSQDGASWVEKEDSSRHGDPAEQWAFAVRVARAQRDRRLDRRNVLVQARAITDWVEVDEWQDVEALASCVVGVAVDASSSASSASSASPTPTTGSSDCWPLATDLSSSGATTGWIALTGNPIDGFASYGPFESRALAELWCDTAEDYPHDSYSVMEVKVP